jgi:hypothetical protein
VPDLGEHAGDEAAAAYDALMAAGWRVASRPLAVVIDYETAGAAEASWHAHLADWLGRHGFDAIAYGSLSSVMQIGAAHVWAADWDGLAALEPAGMTVHAHQYVAEVRVGDVDFADYSVADDWLMNRGLA